MIRSSVRNKQSNPDSQARHSSPPHPPQNSPATPAHSGLCHPRPDRDTKTHTLADPTKSERSIPHPSATQWPQPPDPESTTCRIECVPPASHPQKNSKTRAAARSTAPQNTRELSKIPRHIAAIFLENAPTSHRLQSQPRQRPIKIHARRRRQMLIFVTPIRPHPRPHARQPRSPPSRLEHGIGRFQIASLQPSPPRYQNQKIPGVLNPRRHTPHGDARRDFKPMSPGNIILPKQCPRQFLHEAISFTSREPGKTNPLHRDWKTGRPSSTPRLSRALGFLA